MKITNAKDVPNISKPEGTDVHYYLFKDYEVHSNDEVAYLAKIVVAGNTPNFVYWEHDKYENKLQNALFSASVVVEEAEVREIDPPDWATTALAEANTTFQEVLSPKPR